MAGQAEQSRTQGSRRRCEATTSSAFDRGHATLACSAKQSSAFCKVLCSKPRKAYWRLSWICHVRLLWEVIQRIQHFSVKQRLLLLTDATRSSFNLICSFWPRVEQSN